MAPALASIREIERAVTSMRTVPGSAAPYQRTSVMTHTAWVPAEWMEAAEDVLAGLAERHPSRTIVLIPEPEEEDGLEGDVEIHVFPVGDGREICTETIRIRLKGGRAAAPASVVQPLFLPDLPAFLRWRGVPAFGEGYFEDLVDVVDRLIVDSTEWPDLPASYEPLAEIFERVVVSDIAWTRTSRWRPQLASLWPGFADIDRIRVTGTAAQGHLLAGWLRSRLERDVALTLDRADDVEAVAADGRELQRPREELLDSSALLSAELEMFRRDRVYEAAVLAV